MLALLVMSSVGLEDHHSRLRKLTLNCSVAQCEPIELYPVEHSQTRCGRHVPWVTPPQDP